jgi:hypothetical protein
MKMHAPFMAIVALIAFHGIANADDHLIQAEKHGLSNKDTSSPPYRENPAGRSGDLAPGQGSPYTGGDTRTPATDTDAANQHANVKPRTPK